MAYQVKYRSTFDDRAGTTFTVEFEKDGAAAGVTTFDLAGRPVTASGGRDGVMLIPPVATRIETVRIVSGETAMYEDIHSDASKWRMRIKEGSTETFLGPVLRSPGRKSGNAFNRGPLEISAMCGIGRLKSLQFYYEAEADGILYEKKTVVGWLLWALNKIGLEYDLYTNVRLYAQSMGADDPLAQEYIRAEAWWGGRNNWSSFSLYDLVLDIATKYLATLTQFEGSWRFYARGSFGSDTFTHYLYAFDNATGTGGTGSTYTAYVSGTQADSLTGKETYYVDEYARVRWIYDHGPLDNLIPNGNFQIRDGSGLKGWTFGDAAVIRSHMGHTQVIRTLTGPRYQSGGLLGTRGITSARGGASVAPSPTVRIPVSQAASQSAAETALLLSTYYADQDDSTEIISGAIEDMFLLGRVNIPLSVQAASDDSVNYLFFVYLKVTVQVGATTYYLSYDPFDETASWTTSSSAWTVFLAPGNTDFEMLIDMPDVPGDGFLKVRLYGAFDTSGVTYTGGVQPAEYIHWQSVQVLPVIDAEGTVQAATGHEVSVNGVAGEEYPELVLMTGTGPTEIHRGAGLTSAGLLLDNWGVGNHGSLTGKSYEQVAAEDLLMQIRLPQDVIRATYSSNVKPSLIKAVKENSKNYLPVFWEYDYKTGQTTVTAVEVSLDGFTPDYTSVTDDSVALLTNLSGGGTALIVQKLNDFIGNLNIQNALTTTTTTLSGTVTSISVEEISQEQAVLSEGKFIVVAGINGGYQEFEIAATPTAPITSISVVSTDMGDKVFPPGSGVHPGTGSLTSVQTQTRNAIYSSVSASQLTELTVQASGAAVTSLTVTATGVDLSDNWIIEVGPSSLAGYEGNFYTLTLNGNHAAGVTTLNVDSGEVRAAVGDSVTLKNVQIVSEINQNAGEIDLRVVRTEVIDDINSVTQTGAVAISAGKVDITGTTTFYSGNNLAQAINAGVTTIDGGMITISSITDTQMSDVALAKVTGAGAAAAADDLDGISDGTTYSRVLTTSISAGKIVLDEVVDGTYSRVLSTQLSAGVIQLSAVNGDLDDLDDGATYGRVLKTELSAGSITITGSDGLTTVITGGSIQSASIKTGDIAANTITAGNIAAGTITTTEIAAATITGGNIAAGTITATNISAGTITATEIATGAVTTAKIAAGAVTATEISVSSLQSVSTSTGSLTVDGTMTIGATGGIVSSSATNTVSLSYGGGLSISTSGGSTATVQASLVSISSGTGNSVSIVASAGGASITVSGTASMFVGGNAVLTSASSLNASNISSGTLSTARMDSTVVIESDIGSGLQVVSGTVKINAQAGSGGGGGVTGGDTLTIECDDGTTMIVRGDIV